MDLLDNPFDFRVPRSGRIDEVIAWFLWVELLMTEEEGVIVIPDESLQAGVVDLVVEVGVDAPLIVEVEQPEDVCSFDHDEAVEPRLGQVQEVLVLLK